MGLGLARLLAAKNSGLTKLELLAMEWDSDRRIIDAFTSFAQALAGNTKLHSLHMVYCTLSQDSIVSLAKSLSRNSTLEELNLSNVNCCDLSSTALIDLSAPAVNALANMIATNNALLQLDLNGMRGDMGHWGRP